MKGAKNKLVDGMMESVIIAIGIRERIFWTSESFYNKCVDMLSNLNMPPHLYSGIVDAIHEDNIKEKVCVKIWDPVKHIFYVFTQPQWYVKLDRDRIKHACKEHDINPGLLLTREQKIKKLAEVMRKHLDSGME